MVVELVEVEEEVLVELVEVEEVETDVLVELVLVLEVEELVEEMEVEVDDVDVVVVILDEVEVLEVEVLEVEVEVEEVLVLDVLVEVVWRTGSINCPTANLYTLFDITAEALERLEGLILCIVGTMALDIIFNCPVVSLYPQTPVVCSHSVQEPMLQIDSWETQPTD